MTSTALLNPKELGHPTSSRFDAPNTYFPNLDGLRFFAALFIVIHHIEQIKSRFGIANVWGEPPILALKHGVTIFFVLSGFLITYLLLEEKEKNGSVSVLRFYMRRILRIWPLYYLSVLLGFFVFPYLSLLELPGLSLASLHNDFGVRLLLSLLILPNILAVSFGNAPYTNQNWSIGTEEQYYIFWPLMMRFFKSTLLALVLVYAAYFAVKLLIHTITLDTHIPGISHFWDLFSMDCLAMGGLAAWVFHRGAACNQAICHPLTQSFLFPITFLPLLHGYVWPVCSKEIYTVLFALVIINLASTETALFRIDHTILRYLGRVSFGLYVWHGCGIVLAIHMCLAGNILNDWGIYTLSFLISSILAVLSYELLEKHFLKLRRYFTP